MKTGTSLTDTEIKKAVECCRQPVGSGSCNYCPFDYQRKKRLEKNDKSCTELMFGCVLDLMNRKDKQIDELVEINLNHEEAIKKAKEACYQCQERHKEEIKIAKSEAVKEFAERLMQRKYQSSDWSHGEHPYVVEVDDILVILEEMGCGE